MNRTFWTRVKTTGHISTFGPFDTRQQAIDAGMAHVVASAKEILTGYGTMGPDFGIEWHRNETTARMEWLAS